MSDRELKALSQEEMRKRLYQTFKEKGILDSLKSQLRNHLIHELKHQAFSGAQSFLSENLNKESLIHRASNSLVADHLARCGYEYTLSVFYPECGLEKEKVFSADDLLHLMNIHPKSKLYKFMISSLQDKNAKGFLFQMLTEMTEHQLHKESRDADTQTVPNSLHTSIVEKLQLIDEQFEERYLKRPHYESLEIKLSEYRKEMEEQLQLEMHQKLQHFKEVEIASIKLEEKEKSQKEIADFQRQLEKAYQLKSESLLSREKNAIERLQTQQEIEAKEMYSQRQTLLKEIELVRSRETDFRQRMEAFELAKQLQEEKTKSVEELLRKRQLEVRKLEDNFENKLKNELLRYQIELKEEYLKRTQKVSEDENRNKEEAAHLREEAIILNMKKQEVEKAVSHTRELETEVNALNVQLSLLTKQNHQLTEKLRETIDYPLVIQEKAELQAQSKSLKEQLEEVRKENQLLRDRAIKPAVEYAALQEEFKILENARKQEQDEFKMRRELLERQLQTEVERYTELKMQLLGSEDSARRLNAEVEQLEFQLRHTRQAFEKEVYRNPKPSFVDRSVQGFTTSRTGPPYIYIDKDPLKSHLVFNAFEAGGTSNSHYCYAARTRSSSPDSDLEFVANTKAKIKELEKDAEYLEEAYRNYKDRLIYAAEVESMTQSSAQPRRGFLNNVSTASHQKVNFVGDNLTPQQHILLNRLKTQRCEELVTTECERTPLVSKVSSRRLSSTPKANVFQTINKKEHISSEVTDHDGSYISSSHHSRNKPLSPIPKNSQFPTLNQEVSLLCQETEKNLVSRDHHSAVSDPLQSSIHSELKQLNFDDLIHSDSSLHDQEDIPEQQECDISHPSEDLAHNNPFIADVQRTPSPQLDSSTSQQKKNNISNEQGDIEEEINTYDTQNKSGRQLEEYHSLENEAEPKEKLMAESKISETEREIDEDHLRLREPEDAGASAKVGVSPMDKYMQMLAQNRAEEQTEKVNKESLEDLSVVEKLSNDSITALSHGEADDDFW
ncbi:centriole and centriolar satellite protein OFD1 [Pelobates fuscus]|uniref:centriole and centriolar satellite protein OFD1 n=1 Tax=Pelobates fuscus TaxID=191477 RepID=UPI002FE4C323